MSYKTGELIEFLDRLIIIDSTNRSMSSEKHETAIVVCVLATAGSFQRYSILFRGALCFFNVWHDTAHYSRSIGNCND